MVFSLIKLQRGLELARGGLPLLPPQMLGFLSQSSIFLIRQLDHFAEQPAQALLLSSSSLT